jgi:hypothetical protein
LTNDCSVTSFNDDSKSNSLCALGSEETQVLCLERIVRRLLNSSEKIFGFTSKRGIVDFHLIALDDSHISWDVVSALQSHQITWNETTSIDSFLVSVSDDHSARRDEILKLGHELSRLGSLHVGEDSGNNNHTSQHEAQVEVRRIFSVNGKANKTEEGSEPQQETEEASHFVDEHAVPRHNALLCERVLAPLG